MSHNFPLGALNGNFKLMFLRKTVCLPLLLLALLSPVRAQDEASPAEPMDERLEEMRRQGRVYELLADDGRRGQLHPEPLLRFNNTVSGVPDGVIMMWTIDSQPVALAQLFLVKGGIWVHEMQAVNDKPFRLRNTESDQIPWQPRASEVKWSLLEQAAAPKASAPLRLSQMRSLIKTFSASEYFRINPTDAAELYELRLLPSPLYRYSSPEQNIIDGAVFAFVNGTDPEVLCLIEAWGEPDNPQWRYAFAAMTCWQVNAKVDGQEVWSEPERYEQGTRDGDYNVWGYGAVQERQVPQKTFLQRLLGQ